MDVVQNEWQDKEWEFYKDPMNSKIFLSLISDPHDTKRQKLLWYSHGTSGQFRKPQLLQHFCHFPPLASSHTVVFLLLLFIYFDKSLPSAFAALVQVDIFFSAVWMVLRLVHDLWYGQAYGA